MRWQFGNGTRLSAFNERGDMDTLQAVQALQFSHREEAERLLLPFLAATFSLEVAGVELRPQAVSLNSFNGFLTLTDGRRLFFKTHTEHDTVISEYYNAAMLAEAGYPVIQPLMASTETGKQLLIYEVIEDPSVFDLAWELETQTTGNDGAALLASLTQAQHAADDALFELYKATLHWQNAEEAAKSPIHQLFYHRLTGGRLERFYGAWPGVVEQNAPFGLPAGWATMADLRTLHWTINGQRYTDTLNDLIAKAVQVLQPAQDGPAVVGHGDAHNGNVFYQGKDHSPSLLYFDPAFAGRHHPLLDLTKPLFHNVFAMWMYHPHVKAAQLQMICREADGEERRCIVEHTYRLPAVREMFLASKVQRVLIPVTAHLQERGWLRPDWRSYLKAALFCCPFLTMNLADTTRFPPEVSLLGFCMAVEMGAESAGQRSRIDQVLDEVAQALA